MQCKVIFGFPTKIEEKINDWLTEQQATADIKFITQSESSMKDTSFVTVIIWYEEKI